MCRGSTPAILGRVGFSLTSVAAQIGGRVQTVDNLFLGRACIVVAQGFGNGPNV